MDMKSLKDSVEIYYDQTLGIGTYGQVCRAKYGQLPCAAKVLHQTLFQFSRESGTHDYTTKFEQECEFLSAMKHPNIVQHLGTFNEPQSGRPVLLMEMLDESLTFHLKRHPGPLPYHRQVNICHDVALALSYLHSNSIIHRDLSSNNVLLIRGGSKSKVTDFGLYKLIDANPCVSPLSSGQGTLAYMAPEVLLIPPNYSSAMDSFSFGVLTLQVITRNFPDPGDAHKYVEDTSHTTGRVVVQFPELERRRKDIDLVEPDHPLLPIALLCLKDRDTERPSADDVCEKLASLKMESAYSESMERSGVESSSPSRMQEELEAKEQIIREFEIELKEQKQAIDKLKEQLEASQHTMEEKRVKQERERLMQAEKFEAEMRTKQEEHENEIEKMREEMATNKHLMKDEKSDLEQKEELEKDPEEKLQGQTRADDQEKVKDLMEECHSKQSKGTNEDHDDEQSNTKTPSSTDYASIQHDSLSPELSEESQLKLTEEPKPKQKIEVCVESEIIKELETKDQDPETKDQEPQAKDIEPKPKDLQPETKDQEPKTKDVEPEAKDEPKSTDQEPEAKDQEPEPKDAEPEAKDQEPKTTDVEPEAKDLQPEPKDAEPEAKDQEPKTTDVEPEAKDLQPEPKDAEPEAKDQEPEAKHQEPKTTEQEPEAKDQEPEAKDQEPKAIRREETSVEAEPASQMMEVALVPPLTNLSPDSTLTWSQGKAAPEFMSSLNGTVVVHGNTAYFSRYFNIYSYRLSEDKWDKLRSSQYQSFSMVVIDNMLTTIGGIGRDKKRTKCLYSLSSSRKGKKWKEHYPPMPTHRVCAAALTTPTHLVVAGGRDKAELCTVEVMNRESFQWSSAVDLPEPMGHLHMILCSGSMYACKQQAFYSCSLEKFLLSCHEAVSDDQPSADRASLWSKLPDIPTENGYSLAPYGEQVLAIGGENSWEKATATLHGYDSTNATWSTMGEMPTTRIDTMAAVLARGELVVVGGWCSSETFNITEIAKYYVNN